MAGPRVTPQQLDPLGGVTAQAYAWVLGLGALGMALVVSAIQWPATAPGWLIAAIVPLAGAVAVALWASAPQRAPFTWRSAVLMHVLALCAVWLEAASRWGIDAAPSWGWGPLALALLIIVTGSFRPAIEVAIESLAATIAVFGIAYAAGAASGTEPIAAATIAAMPVLCVGAGATAYSAVLVRRLLAWREDTSRSRRAEALRLREQAREELRTHRLGLVEREIEPFLRSLLAAGSSDAAAAAEARRLAGELRALLTDQREQAWLSELVGELTDPDRLAARMDETQRAAVEALCAALGRRAPRAVLRRQGARGVLVITWERGPGRLGPELLAMARHVFPGTRIALTARRIELGFAAGDGAELRR
ncbi:MAG TPA: hypothetical protein VNQ52_05665 [Microbacteriaceae bacterium]|nr:hypothetical protein [Microbacteriaceae bacterium]